MKEILLAIMERLRAKVPGLAYIAEDWGQMDYYHEAPPVKFPCALISVGGADFESQTSSVRWGKMRILIRVADAPSVSGTMAAPKSYRERAFAILDLMDNIGNALYGYGEDGFNELEQASITRYEREDAIREYAMTFETEYAIESE